MSNSTSNASWLTRKRASMCRWVIKIEFFGIVFFVAWLYGLTYWLCFMHYRKSVNSSSGLPRTLTISTKWLMRTTFSKSLSSLITFQKARDYDALWIFPKVVFCRKVRSKINCDFASTDYVGFIKRVMKQVQRPAYADIKHFEVDLTPLEEAEVVAPPRKCSSVSSMIFYRHRSKF